MPEPTLRTRHSSSTSSDDGTMRKDPPRGSSGDQRATLMTPPLSARRGASKEFRGRGYEVGRRDIFSAQRDVWGTSGNDGDDDDDDSGCVTLAITTCKRLRAFLGTAEGLQACYSTVPTAAVQEPRIDFYSLSLPHVVRCLILKWCWLGPCCKTVHASWPTCHLQVLMGRPSTKLSPKRSPPGALANENML